MKKKIFGIILSTIWISVSEFVRNEFILKTYWTEHYKSMGLVFPSEPINGAIWGMWSLCLALAIFILAQRFNLVETTFLAWLVGFVMMWLVIGNMSVLPFGILPIAIPLSILEAFGAAFIVKKLASTQN